MSQNPLQGLAPFFLFTIYMYIRILSGMVIGGEYFLNRIENPCRFEDSITENTSPPIPTNALRHTGGAVQCGSHVLTKPYYQEY